MSTIEGVVEEGVVEIRDLVNKTVIPKNGNRKIIFFPVFLDKIVDVSL